MSIAQTFLALPIWWINGVLSMVYWSIGHLAEILAILAGAVILFGVDPIVQQRASERPRRHERGGVQTSTPNAQYLPWQQCWFGSSSRYFHSFQYP
jgi:hypothetical protein